MRFSVIIAVYNRPFELKELLTSLVNQSYKDFEVLVVEDGSEVTSYHVIKEFSRLALSYYVKPNSGQGFSRNYGFERASEDFLIVLDSDVVLPADYLENVAEAFLKEPFDAFGGPDRTFPGSGSMQRAISFAMTSFFTTGGIRGKAKNLGGHFHPRSFNMGFTKQVYKTVGGFRITRLGEDIDLSIRIYKAGFTVKFIPKAYVYHKRRNSFSEFWKQMHFFGRARINLYSLHPDSLRLVHFFPAIFTISVILIPFSFILGRWAALFFALLFVWVLSVFIEGFIVSKNVGIAFLGIAASFIQLLAYGAGFLSALAKYYLH